LSPPHYSFTKDTIIVFHNNTIPRYDARQPATSYPGHGLFIFLSIAPAILLIVWNPSWPVHLCKASASVQAQTHKTPRSLRIYNLFSIRVFCFAEYLYLTKDKWVGNSVLFKAWCLFCKAATVNWIVLARDLYFPLTSRTIRTIAEKQRKWMIYGY
jgi:hypothetical protein